MLVPTETGYGFVADSSKESSHTAFLNLRPSHAKNKPFSIVCTNMAQVSQLAQFPTTLFRIATRIWPGPYTLLLECNKNTPKIAAGPKRKTVGIRLCSHPVIRALMEEFGRPLLITSVTDEDELLEDDYFNSDEHEDAWWTSVPEICSRFQKGLIALALENDEPVPMSVSTVVDFSCSPPVVVRDGGWPLDFIDAN